MPLLGAVVFGGWHFYYGVTGLAGDRPEHLIQDTGMVLVAVLLIALGAKWLRAAWFARDAPCCRRRIRVPPVRKLGQARHKTLTQAIDISVSTAG